MQASLVICALLVLVTILFERCRHALERSVPRLMVGVLQALFGELTVLGFITVFAYGLVQFDVLSRLSAALYHDPSHLVHLFEQIHFLLFFVMLLFLAQALVLVRASLRYERWWLRLERLVTDPEMTTGACEVGGRTARGGRRTQPR